MGLKTATETKTSLLDANLSQLPLLKNYSKSEIVTKVDNFRKGEKGLFWVFKLGALAALGVLGYFTCAYVLPPIFQAIGRASATIVTVIMTVGAVMLAPAIFKALRRFTRWVHKGVVKAAPFDQLEDERKKMISNQATFRVAKGGVVQVKSEMEVESANAKKEAETGQVRIITLQGKAEKKKAEIEDLVKTKGVKIKEEDEYIEKVLELQKILAESSQVIQKTQQSKDFVQKYGTRANILKKVIQKLNMYETSMEIKLSDFDATVEMLKKDYYSGQKLNAASSAAKSALGFSKGWEMDYALDVIKSTISADIAMTAGNLKDIETLTTSGNYILDSDELFANLNQIAEKIKVGTDVVPDNKKYNNPDYKLTTEDRVKSNGFGDLF